MRCLDPSLTPGCCRAQAVTLSGQLFRPALGGYCSVRTLTAWPEPVQIYLTVRTLHPTQREHSMTRKQSVRRAWHRAGHTNDLLLHDQVVALVHVEGLSLLCVHPDVRPRALQRRAVMKKCRFPVRWQACKLLRWHGWQRSCSAAESCRPGGLMRVCAWCMLSLASQT